jgi:hypothetical protein
MLLVVWLSILATLYTTSVEQLIVIQLAENSLLSSSSRVDIATGYGLDGRGCVEGMVVTWFEVVSSHFPGATEENHEVPQYDRSSGLDLNPWPREYKAGVLATWPLVLFCIIPCGPVYICNAVKT